jgi:hypothetical protein
VFRVLLDPAGALSRAALCSALVPPRLRLPLTLPLQDFELCGYTIPAGTRLQCSLQHTLHTDSRWQAEDDPLAFKPERWLGQRDGAWIPFGGGPRLCLGWLMAMVEMKVSVGLLFGKAVQGCNTTSGGRWEAWDHKERFMAQACRPLFSASTP